MNCQQLLECVAELPGEEGWWKSDTGEVFDWAAKLLVDHGVNPEVIYDVLSSLHAAVREEYGD